MVPEMPQAPITIPSIGADQRYEGVVHAQPQPNGMMLIVFGTDFSNPHCPRQVFDIRTRQRVRMLQTMQFLVTPAEGQALEWDKR